jgi:membrane-bound lytic murein transglycosylase A
LKRALRLGAALCAPLLLGHCKIFPPGAPAPEARIACFVPASPGAVAGLGDEQVLAAWPAWLASCQAWITSRGADAGAWRAACAKADGVDARDPSAVRAYFAGNFEPYAVHAIEPVDVPDVRACEAAPAEGLATGYFEPEFEARSTRSEDFPAPIYAPSDRPDARPRAELLRSGALAGRELFFLRHAMDAFTLEVQGSGRLRLADGTTVRVSYAGSNGQPYRSIGAWLVAQGEIAPDRVSMASIRAWADAHADRVDELLEQDPRMIFFRVRDRAQSAPGPEGTLGVALRAGVSLAVDPHALPLGAPVLVQGLDASPATRLAFAQDTGGAIRGPLRIDVFEGCGGAAGEVAGSRRDRVGLQLLVPRGVSPRDSP